MPLLGQFSLSKSDLSTNVKARPVFVCCVVLSCLVLCEVCCVTCDVGCVQDFRGCVQDWAGPPQPDRPSAGPPSGGTPPLPDPPSGGLWPTLANPIQANPFLASPFGQPIWANPFLAKIRGLWFVVWPILAKQIWDNPFLANPFLCCVVVDVGDGVLFVVLLCVVVCVVVCCVVCCCFGPSPPDPPLLGTSLPHPSTGHPSTGHPSTRPPKISLCFSLSRPHFVLFVCLWLSSR